MYTGGEDGVCRIWEMRSNQLVANRLLSFSGNGVTSMVPNINQTDLFISTMSGHVWIWDVVNHMFMRLPMPDDLKIQEYVHRLAVHPSGKKLTGVTNKVKNGEMGWKIYRKKRENGQKFIANFNFQKCFEFFFEFFEKRSKIFDYDSELFR